MARKGRRSTAPKRFRIPTDAEWIQMRPFKQFVILSPSKSTQGQMDREIFKVNDDKPSIRVRSTETRTNVNQWLCRIAEIRCRESDNNPWVKVYWYYSGYDISTANGVTGFKASQIADNERMLSSHWEYLEWNCLDRVVDIYPWFSDQLDPPEISEDTFFTRHVINFETKPLFNPPLREHKCGICSESLMYNPFPASFRASDTYWHFCPRPQCRKWFHRSCLLHSFEEPDLDSYVGSHKLRILAVDPDDQNPHPSFVQFTYPKPDRGKDSSEFNLSNMANAKWEEMLSKIQSKLHPSILTIAQQPIVRHPNTGNLSIVGNLKDVVLARRLVYHVLEGSQNWIVNRANELLSKPESATTTHMMDSEVWDMLSHCRLLASPYEPFWRRLEIQHSGTTHVMCNSCGGAI
ncbi:hypothetical protein C8Q75DRAFT_811079 [Abortiporus biennis]|nr:hypothetical protein C8Q75DRAFT_811079 [Abortiporus biennis]